MSLFGLPGGHTVCPFSAFPKTAVVHCIDRDPFLTLRRSRAPRPAEAIPSPLTQSRSVRIRAARNLNHKLCLTTGETRSQAAAREEQRVRNPPRSLGRPSGSRTFIWSPCCAVFHVGRKVRELFLVSKVAYTVLGIVLSALQTLLLLVEIAGLTSTSAPGKTCV